MNTTMPRSAPDPWDDSAVRTAVPALRGRLARATIWIYVVIGAEALIAALQGSRKWTTVWIVLLVASGALVVSGLGKGRARDRFVLARPAGVVRAYLRARLAVAERSARAFGLWLLAGGVFIALGVMHVARGESTELLNGARTLLMGCGFVGSRLVARYVRAPRLAEELAALGGSPDEAAQGAADGDVLTALTGEALAELGRPQALALRRETVQETFGETRRTLDSLARA